MQNSEIKQILILQFKGFDITEEIDLNVGQNEEVELNCGFEYKVGSKWHEVYLEVNVTVFKKKDEFYEIDEIYWDDVKVIKDGEEVKDVLTGEDLPAFEY